MFRLGRRLVLLVATGATMFLAAVLAADPNNAVPAPPAEYSWISQQDLSQAFAPNRDVALAVQELPLAIEQREKLLTTIAVFRAARDAGGPPNGTDPHGRCLQHERDGEIGAPPPGTRTGTLAELVERRSAGMVVVVEVVGEWPGWSGETGNVATVVRGAIREVLWRAPGQNAIDDLYFIATGGEISVGDLTLCRQINDMYPRPRPGDRVLLWTARHSDDARFAATMLRLPVHGLDVDFRTCGSCSERGAIPIDQLRRTLASIRATAAN